MPIPSEPHPHRRPEPEARDGRDGDAPLGPDEGADVALGGGVLRGHPRLDGLSKRST